MDTALNRVPALDAQKKMWCSRTPMNRLGNVDELNNTAIFLASDASTFMTGSDIVVDVSLLHPATCYLVLTRHRVVTASGKMHVYHFHCSSVHTCAFGVFIFRMFQPDDFHSVAWTNTHGRFKPITVGFVSGGEQGSGGVPAEIV